MKRLAITLFGLVASLGIAADTLGNTDWTTPCGYVRVEGAIASIDAGSLQLAVGDTTVQIADDTTIKAGRNLLAFSDLEMGKTVAAVGTVSDDVLTAVRINVKYTGRGVAKADGSRVQPGRRAWKGQDRGMGRMAGCKLQGNGPNRSDRDRACRGQGQGNGNRPCWRQESAGGGGKGWGDGLRQGRRQGPIGGQGRACKALALPLADGGTIDEATEAALREALLDEYANKLYYEALVESFGSSRRFDNLIRAEQRHAGALLNLFERYGIEPPTQDEATVPAVPSTLQEAILLAIDGEEANVAMYDEVLESVAAADVAFVFTKLRDTSAKRHIPSLERTLP